MDTIFTRRSVRKFSNKEVEPEKVEQMLRAAMQAPSAGNQQPWEFLVVTGRENLDALQPFGQYTQPLGTATLAIIVICAEDRLKFPHMYQQDLGAATQNIMLEACELGLGSVWLGTAPIEERIEFIRKLYDLDSTKVPYSVIAIGYPEVVDANKFIDRFDESRIKYIK